MPTSNEELLNKADVTTSTGGQMSAENADKFISTVIEQSDLLKMVTAYRMKAAQRTIDSIAIGSRQLIYAAEGTEPNTNATLTLPRRTLTNKEVLLPYKLTDSFLEENVEGGSAESAITAAFAAAFANDLADLMINGDEDSGNTFLALNNGILKIAGADSLVNDFTVNTGMSYKDIFKGMLSVLPQKYHKFKKELAFMVSPTDEIEYRNELAARNTALGDAILAGDAPVYYQGIKVLPVYAMPETKFLLTTPKNFALGIGRDIRYEKERKMKARAWEYMLTAKVDFEYAVSELIVLGA